jgi:hypothetical protein
VTRIYHVLDENYEPVDDLVNLEDPDPVRSAILKAALCVLRGQPERVIVASTEGGFTMAKPILIHLIMLRPDR